MKKLMIGGTALVKLGSSRQTDDVDYLIITEGELTEVKKVINSVRK